MPAEWEPHEATWLAWPHNPEDWPGKFQAIPWLYAEIVRLLAARRARASHRSRTQKEESRATRHPSPRRRQSRSASAFTSGQPTAYGPATPAPSSSATPKASMAITNWHFNAWAKYADWHLDDQVPGHVTEVLGLAEWQPAIPLPDGTSRRLVLEGGSIDTNGAGILLTTEECLLSEVQQRNPGVSREQLEQAFHDYPRHRPGHLARSRHRRRRHPRPRRRHQPLRRPGTIITAVEPDTSDPNHAAARRKSRTPESRTHAGREAVHHRRTAAAAPGCISRPAPAGQLRQLLYGQRTRPRAHIP